MQQAAFDTLGIAATYEAIDATDAQLIMTRLRDEDFAGWNVTTPLKEAVMSHVDELTDVASRARSINVIRRDADRLIGHNTDGEGFVRAARELWSERALSGSILILGSGPAARGIARALQDAGVADLTCWARDERRALAVGPQPRRQPQLAVWAMPPDAVLPTEIAALARNAPMFFDCNYGAGRSMGLREGAPNAGSLMLLHQAILSFEWWTGLRAPQQIMRAAITGSASGES